MTKSDFADLMLGRRFSPAMRKALEMILVEGKGQTEVARQLGLHKQAVNRSLGKVRNG